jgi:probable HAF family extracellular repeat protein
VVGRTATFAAGGNPQAFLYSAGSMYALGTLTALGGTDTPSAAISVNSSGVIVGYSGGTDSRAWVGVPTQPNGTNGQMTDLNSLIPAGSGWVLTSASGINDAGQIVGTRTMNGVQRGFLLTPQ